MRGDVHKLCKQNLKLKSNFIKTLAMILIDNCDRARWDVVDDIETNGNALSPAMIMMMLKNDNNDIETNAIIALSIGLA